MSHPAPVGQSRYGILRQPSRPSRILGGVLGHYRDRNRSATIPHAIRMLEESGTIDNFRRLIGRSARPYSGMVFQDSDLYKTLEGIAWELGKADDQALRGFFDEMVELLSAAQREDGYLNSFLQREDRTAEPWENISDNHELYCLGHLVQAAVAAKRAMGDDRLLAIALRYVDLVVDLFGDDGSSVTCGHPEIETALVELYRETADARHLDLARRFVERRGRKTLHRTGTGPAYFQDDVPVRESTILRGHAVRALYLNAGVTDLYLETGDTGYLDVMLAQWQDLESRRLYVTGGTGSRHRDEAFGDAYELPSERAYAETCAGIALMNWAWRMFLADGSPRHLDTLEQALFNVVAAGVSDDGRAFFYSNPLQRRPDHTGAQEESEGHRLPWYSCACCPPNIARTFGSLEGYLAAVGESVVALGVYAPALIEVETPTGDVTLRVETAYPADGAVSIRVENGSSDSELLLRIPSWAEGASATVDGAAVTVPPPGEWLVLPHALSAGTSIELELPMPLRYLAAHPQLDAVRGSIAAARGPVVYCLDQADNALSVESLSLQPEGSPVASAAGLPQGTDELGPLLEVPASVAVSSGETLPLYSAYPYPEPLRESAVAVLRPYALWGNAAVPGGMRVWVPARA